MTRTEKAEFIKKLRDKFSRADAMLAIKFGGLDVKKETELRKMFREGKVEYQVVKNTLARIAADGTDAEPMKQWFQGPTAIVFGFDDVVAPAKILHAFLKDNKDKLEVKGGVVQGNVVDVDQIADLASLPSLDELRATMVALFNTPATSLVRLLNTPGQQLAAVIQARSEQADA